MSIRNQNWYNLQSTRRYPLDDISSGVDDTGAFIRDDIIVDCHIRFPNTLGKYLYVQGITVSAGLVTVVFGVSNNIDDLTGTTIAAISAVKPAAPYVHYSVTGLVDGISGWIVFGPGITENFTARYTTPKQTLLQPRSARPYRPLPIPTIGKLGLATALQDVVKILGSSPVLVTQETITHAGTQYQALVFRLDIADLSINYNPLEEFLGPCGQRPESGTCPKAPIETINGIAPDCAGNIVIDFSSADFSTRPFTNCGGVDIVTDVGLAALCEANKPKKPQEFKDDCCDLTGEEVITLPDRASFPVAGETGKLYRAEDTNKIYRWENNDYAETDIVLDAYCWPDPTQAIDEFIDETPTFADRNYQCLTAPLCVDFISCAPGEYMATVDGIFSPQTTLAPPPCNNCEQLNDIPALSSHGVYVSTGIGGTNITLLKNCATDWAIGKTFSTQLRIGANGVARNGGLVLNYTQTIEFGRLITRYIVVLIDATRGRLRVLRNIDGAFTEEATVNYPAKINVWYTLNAVLNRSGNNVVVNFSVAEINGFNSAAGVTVITNPGDTTGAAGLFANQSTTYFNKFTVQ